MFLDDRPESSHEVGAIESVEGVREQEWALPICFLSPILFLNPDQKLVREAQDNARSLCVRGSTEECLSEQVGSEVDPEVVGFIRDVVTAGGRSARGEDGSGNGTN